MAFIGIDLGTTNSLVAIWRDGKCELIPNALGELLTPSVISIDGDRIIIGKAARDRLVSHPTQTVARFKRLMGTAEKVRFGKKSFLPEELSALILKQLKVDAEQQLGIPIEEAIISVPAYFNDNQRNATKVAAQIAGLKVERLINEPTAAAIAYGIHEVADEKKFIVIDLGGGTFDVSVMEKFDDLLEVHASAGDSFLGGEDFSDRLMREICRHLDIDYNLLQAGDQGRLYRLFDELKRNLSNQDSASIGFELDGRPYQHTVTREDFFNIVEPLFKKLLAPIEKSIRDANIKVNDIDEIYLVGGATRMPAIRHFVTRLFGRFPSSDIDPDHAVAIGAAIQSALKQRNQDLKDIVLTDVCPFSMGIETANQTQDGPQIGGIYSVIIERNQTIPTSRVERYHTLRDKQTAIEIRIFQGEDRLVKNNVKLGELGVNVPKAKAGEESVDVRFTYDINGLLEVIVTVVSTGQSSRLVIQNSTSRMSDSEIDAALRKLESIKIHPREQVRNQALLSRAERLYQERLGPERDQIGLVITDFEHCLNQQDERQIEIACRSLESFLNSIEDNIWS